MEAVLNHQEPQPDILRQRSFPIGEPSEIAAARRAGNELARRIGFDDVRTGQLAIIISEAATNIVKHAQRGEILLRKVLRGGTAGIEVLAIDSGPGMANVRQHMQDGHSTTGTYGVGLGLGGAKRLADAFYIDTVPGAGTTVTIAKWKLF